MKSYIVTLVGSFLGLLSFVFLRQEMNAPLVVSIFAFVVVLFLFIFIFIKDCRINIDLKKVKSKKSLISKIAIITTAVWIMFSFSATKAYKGLNIDDFIYVNIPSVVILLIIILFKTYKNEPQTPNL